jgi:hypothetical protein
MAKIKTLKQIHETLVQLGYEASLKENSVALKVGGIEQPFPAVITHNKLTEHFQITCMVATLGKVPESKLAAFALAALDANHRIVPYAYALISEASDPTHDKPEDWPVVLMDSLPIGDLSPEELSASMQSLVAALVDSRQVLGMFTAKL